MAYQKIVVAIDFGTTYSALAWANASTPEHITIIGNWPSAGSRTHHSAPTEISYSPTNTDEWTWGYDIPANVRRHKWFKLLLEADEEKFSTDAGGMTLPVGKLPVDIARDYISSLYHHAMQTLWRQNSAEVMRMTKVDFVLTVPACWGEAAKARTRKAALQAGVGGDHELQLLTEPEAAAVYAIKTQETGGIHVNDRIVVCDAGGGTVDLISYTVQQLYPSLAVTECCVGTGEFCGSTYIDRRFEDFLKLRLGETYNKLRVETQQRIVKNFEEVKCAFDDREEKDRYHVSIPTVDTIVEARVFNGEMEVTRAELKELFDPVIDRIITLVSGQVNASSIDGRVNSILLVGGFGESKYLFKRMNTWALPYNIGVLQPRDAATAVVKGAVLRGLETTTSHTTGSSTSITRLSRSYYGTPMSCPFIPHRHSELDAYVDPVTQQKMARNQIAWFIRKGEPLSDSRRITRNFNRTFKKYKGPWEDWIVMCSSDVPPERMTPDVKKLCIVETDLGGEKKRFEKQWDWGNFKRYWIARYSLEMQIGGGGMEFECVFGGKRYGSVKVDFEVNPAEMQG